MREFGTRWAWVVVLFVGLASTTGARAQAAPGSASAPPDKQGPLYETVKGLDKQLFDAYNHCDLGTLGKMVADDLEFYHDKTGLMRGKEKFLDAIKQNICGKVNRQLVEGSLEVYPIDTYGAVEIGIHRFTHPSESGDQQLGEAKFVHLWQKTDAGWKVTRVISYNHEPLAK